jgi:indolepyruvate ferredoxin oxidoreductase beta subunit
VHVARNPRDVERLARIDAWLGLILDAAVTDVALAAEIAASQRLVKGYSDTFERGLARFDRIMIEARALRGSLAPPIAFAA